MQLYTIIMTKKNNNQHVEYMPHMFDVSVITTFMKRITNMGKIKIIKSIQTKYI